MATAVHPHAHVGPEHTRGGACAAQEYVRRWQGSRGGRGIPKLAVVANAGRVPVGRRCISAELESLAVEVYI